MSSTPIKSARPGKDTLGIEVQGVSKFGVWLFVHGEEFFLPFDEYPWFKEASISQVMNVRLINENHLEWPDLDVDVDLEMDSLKHPEKHPLKYSK